MRLAVLASIPVLLAALKVATSKSTEMVPGSPVKVAVLPFRVSGGPEVRYLTTGIMDLLTTSLDQADDLRAVDPSAMAKEVDEVGLGKVAISPDYGSATAYRFRARLFVLGDAVTSGKRLRITATLYDRSAGGVPTGRAAVEGTIDQLFDLVDQLGEQLIAGRYQLPSQRLSGVAASSTRSLPALKAYLAGEEHLRQDRHDQAIEAYKRAIRADSGFALAHYRLSVAADRAGLEQLARSAAEKAARLAPSLSERDRSLLEAYLDLKAGRIDRAESEYESVLSAYPNDVEGWFGLAELLFHANPLRGRSVTEAANPLRRVLDLDPEQVEALVHLARIEFLEGREAQSKELISTALGLVTDSSALELRAFRSFVLTDAPGRQRVADWLTARPPGARAVTTLQVAVELDDLDGSERFAHDLAAIDAVEAKGFAHRLQAVVAVSRGQWSAARRSLAVAAPFDSTAALEVESSLAVLPFIEVPAGDLVNLRDKLERWTPDSGGSPRQHEELHPGLHRAIRLHALGLVTARLGEVTTAARIADAIERTSPDQSGFNYGATLAASIRARVAVAIGRGDEALRLLDNARWVELPQLFSAEVADRYLRAHLLQRLGRNEEALGYYRSIAQRAAYELVFLAPAELHQGEIYRQMGNRAQAERHLRKFLALWAKADPELHGSLIEARGMLDDLGSIGTDAARP